jgi:hypothetical protein
VEKNEQEQWEDDKSEKFRKFRTRGIRCDSDGDPAWHDGDSELDEDDDLYVENIDDSEEVEMFGKGKKIAAQHAHMSC